MIPVGVVPVWCLYANFQWQSWWRHQMEIFSALLAICAGNSPVSGEFPAQRPETRGFDVFFDLRVNKRLSKQSWGWWLETLSGSLWRQSNGWWWGIYLGHLFGYFKRYPVATKHLWTVRTETQHPNHLSSPTRTQMLRETCSPHNMGSVFFVLSSAIYGFINSG